jgi:hypothetical protein
LSLNIKILGRIGDVGGERIDPEIHGSLDEVAYRVEIVK